MKQYFADHDKSDDDHFAAAIAASAHAIRSLEEENTSHVQISRTNTTKQHPFRPPQGPAGSVRKASSIKDSRNSPSLRPAAMSFNAEAPTTLTTSYSKADAWEKAQIAKIRQRYEKVQSDIQAWENEKKLREKQKLERQKNEMDTRKSRNIKHYERKIGRIDRLGFGARAQVEENRKEEESIVKKKARKMRLTGQTPVTCFCF